MRGILFYPTKSDTHPTIILCNPTSGKLLTLNVSDWGKHDSTCVLDVGDHHGITKKSAVLYFRAKLRDAITLSQLKASCYKVFDQPLDEVVLQRIFQGARNSEDFTDSYLSYLQ